MSHIILRGCWCHIIVLNVHAPTEDKTDDVNDSFYEELERVFDKFPKSSLEVLLGDFNAKIGREDIFEPTIRNEEVRERLAVKKQTSHRFHMERFSLKKFKEAEGKGQYRLEVSNRFGALEDLNAEVEINSAWETIRENIKISAKEL
jgi:hypothetical protein